MLSVKKVCVLVLVLVFLIDGALSISLLEEGKHINHFYHGDSFVYMNFKNAASNLSFGNGIAAITPNRLLRLTNSTHQIGHAFHSRPLRFKNDTTRGGNVFSFSTSFIFSIIKENPREVDAGLSGQGIAFVLAPQPELPGATGNGYLGLFNSSNNGNSSNHVLAVEIDTVYNKEFDTINGDHVGININGIRSVIASPPRYYTDSDGGNRSLGLTSEDRIQVWIEYDGVGTELSVTLAPITVPTPDIPLLSYKHDLSDIFLDSMYAGFSSSTGSVSVSYYILGWSFEISRRETDDRNAKIFGVELPIIIPVFVLMFLIGVVFVVLKIRSEKLADVEVEDWEVNHGRLRRPVELNKSEMEEGEVLVDWVLNCWRSGDILQTTDPNLLNEYVKQEMEIVLKLGLLCSRIDPQARSSMRQVMQYLEGHFPLPDTDLWALNLGTLLMSTSTGECQSCAESSMNRSSSTLGSVLSGPR
ncbi:hypothetical protein MKW98_021140 [Papaver atlanticum]|uniref:Legume lectin domain-containing protein n=1 Tax=Papaver atlanticum TaxID=357466 RepID=A0AAD4XSU3_9MAGN|nr:hypothetical protein MKW98_021140 [Papaver atlanticum]